MVNENSDYTQNHSVMSVIGDLSPTMGSQPWAPFASIVYDLPGHTFAAANTKQPPLSRMCMEQSETRIRT
jgi:hypothetical protein